MFRDIIEVKTNVTITARNDRGKKVPSLCRKGHNIWVNLGRKYLAEVISPLDNNFNAHYNDSPLRVVQYMGVGVGGDSQTIDVDGTYPTFATDYPGQNTFSDEVLTVPYLERPVKVSGVAGTGASAGVWMNEVTAPPTFSGTPITKVTFTCLFDYTDLHLAGAYPAVPMAEIALMTSDQDASLTSEEVYDYGVGAHPDHINVSTRPRLIAYNTFDTITKTASVAFEVTWEIQF